MKKTVTVNLGGIVFHIDEDAFEKLDKYLSKIESGINNSDDAKEIMVDIELRLSEIYKERLGTIRQVINIDDIQYSISIMGEPEDINEDEKKEFKEKSESKSQFGKRLFRDPDDRILGGVCSGLAAFLGVDSIIVRLVFGIFLFMGFGFLVYVLFWIVIPEAKTTAQKLEMRGENVNIENIQKNIREEFEKVKEGINKNKSKHEIHKIISQLFDFVIVIVGGLFKFVFSIIGVLLIITSILLLMVFADIFIFDGWQTGITNLNGIISMIFNPATVNLFILGIFVLVAVPIIKILIYTVKKMIGNKQSYNVINTSLTIAWFIGIILVVFIIINNAKNFNSKAVFTNHEYITDIPSKNIIITTENIDNIIMFDDKNRWHISNDDSFKGIYSLTELHIKKTTDSIPVIKSEKISRGKSKISAYKTAEKIYAAYSINDSIVNIKSRTLIKESQPFRFQKNIITIYIPIYYSVYFSPETINILCSVPEGSYLSPYEYPGKTWKMTQRGLQ